MLCQKQGDNDLLFMFVQQNMYEMGLPSQLHQPYQAAEQSQQLQQQQQQQQHHQQQQQQAYQSVIQNQTQPIQNVAHHQTTHEMPQQQQQQQPHHQQSLPTQQQAPHQQQQTHQQQVAGQNSAFDTFDSIKSAPAQQSHANRYANNVGYVIDSDLFFLALKLGMFVSIKYDF